MKVGRIVKLTCIVLCCAMLLVTVIQLATSRRPRRFTPEEMALVPSTTDMATPWIAPGVVPDMHEVSHARVPDDAPLIGVVVNDEPRAYLLSAMSDMSRHVVNDLVADQCVSVTYCDRTDRVRVFTSPAAAGRLDLGQGGWSGDSMLLQLNNQYFEQDAENAPLQDVPFERTTWKEWKARHSNTKVYDGRASAGDGAGI